MKMRCPKCGVKGSADETLIGKKVRCPKCTEIFTYLDEEQAQSSDAFAPVEIQPEALDSAVSETIDIEPLAADLENEINSDLTEQISQDDESELAVQVDNLADDLFPEQDEPVELSSEELSEEISLKLDDEEPQDDDQPLGIEEADVAESIDDFFGESQPAGDEELEPGGNLQEIEGVDGTDQLLDLEEDDVAVSIDDFFGESQPEAAEEQARESNLLDIEEVDENDLLSAVDEDINDSVDDFFQDSPEEAVADQEEESTLLADELAVELEPENVQILDDIEEETPSVLADFDDSESPEMLFDFGDDEEDDSAEVLLDSENDFEIEIEDEPEQLDVATKESSLEDTEDILEADEDKLILEEDLIVDEASPETAGDVGSMPVFQETDEDVTAVTPPVVKDEQPIAAQQQEAPVQKKTKQKHVPKYILGDKFTITGALKQAWDYTKGAKFTILLASLVALLFSAVVTVAASYILPVVTAGMSDLAKWWINVFTEFGLTFFSSILGAGLMYLGVQRVADKPISYKMVFSGFSQTINLFFCFLFMTLMIVSGTVLLILPGIYLAVGYSLALPLIIDKKIHAWKAMEMSRRAVHKVWWRVFGLFLVIQIIMSLALIPLGLGLIWAQPLYVVLFGVLYRFLFRNQEEE